MTAQPLKGFRDLNPDQALLRYKLESQIHQVARQYGYLHLDTPCLEYAETLLGTGFADTDKEVYVFKDHGDRDVALRFDLTVSFARYVATFCDSLPMPFKRYQVGKVWRGEKPQKGRYREFVQADFDIIGSDSYGADLDVIAALVRSVKGGLKDCGWEPGLKLRLSHRRLINACLKHFMNIDDTAAEARNACLIALDKLQKQGTQRVRELLLKASTAESAAGVDSLLKFMLDTPVVDQWKAFKEEAGWRDLIGSAAQDLDLVQKSLEQPGVKAVIDLSLVRGLAYYTGCVFEMEVEGSEDMGSVSSGGRYDNLVERFTTSKLTGIGGSVGVDRLLAVVERLNESSQTSVKIEHDVGIISAEAHPSSDFSGYLFSVGEQLRNKGFSVVSSVETGKKLGIQFKRLERLHCRYALILGEQERQSGKFAVKDMINKEQTIVSSLDEVCDILRAGSLESK